MVPQSLIMKHTTKLLICWMVLGILGRLIPHPPNITPMLALCLLSTRWFSPRLALLASLGTWISSDIALSLIYHYPMASWWSYFSVSGMAGVVLLGAFAASKSRSPTMWFVTLGVGSVSFWLWSNLGVWLYSGFYTHTVPGLQACYINALPFLGRSLVGDFIWGAVLYKVLEISSLERYNANLV